MYESQNPKIKKTPRGKRNSYLRMTSNSTSISHAVPPIDTHADIPNDRNSKTASPKLTAKCTIWEK